MRWILIALSLFAKLTAEETTTFHEIQLEEPLSYSATVSTGTVSYTAYIKKSEENRPITFTFNGGPGSASSWLHLSALGPRRLLSAEEGSSRVPPYQLVDNLETILDLTDLVFIDPSSTGFSDTDEDCFSVQKDIESVSIFIRDYLSQNNRWNSPRYIAGESYGGVRSAGVADYLQDQYGVYFNGILFISPGIDYQVLVFDADNQLPYFLFLPTYATTAWYHGKANKDLSLEEVVTRARNFAYQTYAPALICPKCQEMADLYPTLADLTGLPLQIIEEWKGKIRDWPFFATLFRDEGKFVGRCDSRITGYSSSNYSDPSLSLTMGPLTAGVHEYFSKELGVKSNYTIFSKEAYKKWVFNDHNKWGYPNLMGALRRTLIANPSMKIYVGLGYFDLCTPFATVEYCIDHLDVPNISLQMDYYEGGHMYYLNPKERVKFKQDLIKFYRN